MVEVYPKTMPKLWNGTESPPNKEMLELWNGLESPPNKEMLMLNIIWAQCIILVEVFL